ncbi:MAG: AAA family ATPase [Propionibacteriaceae bacterium]|jgi:chromosome partitioning protein|nr:AAA family ATPase [Propionibacteriaceae bacterium]
MTAAARRIAYDRPEFDDGGSVEPDDLENVSRETPTLPRPAETRIIVVANQKGGVGKTTTVVNLATALAKCGLRTVVIDLDPQGNASTALGAEHAEGMQGTYEVLNGGNIADLLQRSPEASNLWVLPATIDLAGAEISLVNTLARESQLLHALRKFLLQAAVDYVFIDCPPSLGLLTVNALVAAKEILIPIQCEYYALEGVTQLLRTIELVTNSMNAGLSLSTVLLTMYDSRTKLSNEVAAEVRKYFPLQTLEATIPRSVRVAEAPSFGQSVINYQFSSAGAQAYLAAAREIASQGIGGQQ